MLQGEWGDDCWMRDPAVFEKDGVWHCFYTHLDRRDVEQGNVRLSLARIRSRDLKTWSKPEILLSGPEGFSSPGSILWDGNRFLLCFQSYPVNPGELYGNEDCRLWLMFYHGDTEGVHGGLLGMAWSRDLLHWNV